PSTRAYSSTPTRRTGTRSADDDAGGRRTFRGGWMKRLSLIGSLVLVAAAWAVVAPVAAGADDQKLESDPNDQPVVSVGANATYDHQYGPIAGQDTVDPQLGDVDPATCRQNQEVTCN